MSDALSTLVQRCAHQEEIRKSRFLANAAPVDSPEQALAFLREVADSTATHNCWAYRLGLDYRFNDDGEPGGTAGRPILQAIEGQRMDGVVVVLTRWYGGIKLGAGGLVRAYGGTAAECLRRAERTPIIPMATLALSSTFAELALLKARMLEFDASIVHEDLTADGADLQLRLPVSRVEEATLRIADLTRGHGHVVRID
jgi:uncharacterized YigZ family protein